MSVTVKLRGNLLSRWVLYKGEVCRLPPGCHNIKVLSGYAWVTTTGKDIMLAEAEEAPIIATEPVLISALRNTPLIFEILGDEKDYSAGIQLTPNGSCSKQFAKGICN